MAAKKPGDKKPTTIRREELGRTIPKPRDRKPPSTKKK